MQKGNLNGIDGVVLAGLIIALSISSCMNEKRITNLEKRFEQQPKVYVEQSIKNPNEAQSEFVFVNDKKFYSKINGVPVEDYINQTESDYNLK